MTWSHPRGYDPMVASSAEWLRRTGVTVTWDRRSLQDFESYPVEELALAYDLIVIDHPHVGQITREGCLSPLDLPGREAEFAEIAAGTVGQSFASYAWQGRQWGFPIDAAAQVQAWRPDLIPAPVKTWAAMMDLARAGRVLLPLRPPHSLMVLYTLSANLGSPCEVQGPKLIDMEIGAQVWAMMRELFELLDPACAEMDPIAVFERMAEPGARAACAPLVYGYVSYAMQGFRPRRIAFADLPVAGGSGPIGSALGGTGIAVSARSAFQREATDFAYWVASGPVQRGPYSAAGGQPAHAAAWGEASVNLAAGNFYLDTRTTLEGAWVRPRHDGYMAFQAAAATRLTQGLADRDTAPRVLADLNRLFTESF